MHGKFLRISFLLFRFDARCFVGIVYRTMVDGTGWRFFFGSGIAIFRFGAFVGILGEEAGVMGMGRGVCGFWDGGFEGVVIFDLCFLLDEMKMEM